MKTKYFIIILAVMLSVSVYAQSNVVTASIKVYGNCSMCKKRIETALDHKGIKKAEWNSKSKQLEVVYNSSKITELQIHEIVAKVGHDTDKVKAKDETYASLPFCCLYRDHEMKDDH
ncbi:MAG: cation transporter [Cytophagales bacterium]|jgi:mercuric ion binding protein|nr:cation transporter [Cytophagales bacterium]MCA6366478.1 cation transporter [Cytophagales bacterium]MCA6374053.1 cation transporter [Cytophagales bacterium]MCA6376818.1 cation transporter [Cytophagales bacterium]MCA6383820.1 cation transporter [Cytophagales bacterium]